MGVVVPASMASPRSPGGVKWDASSLLSTSPKHSARKDGNDQIHRSYDDSALKNSPRSARRSIHTMDFTMDEARYVELLRALCSESEGVQNSPALGLIPREDNISRHVFEYLKEHTQENGGPLIVEHVSALEGRGNVIITYPGSKEGAIMSFVGSHMDVVPADPSTWNVDPFQLTVDGDKLFGRGTTDCLGHVALMTMFFEQLAIQRPTTQRSIVCVLIASEEAESVPVAECGVEHLLKEGRLEQCKAGPVFWIDSADSQPCMGTAGAIEWQLKCDGKIFHSGLPYKGINALEFAMEATSLIQQRFYETFPKTADEERYLYACPSTMKPTQIESSRNSLNQVPAWTTVKGDIRLTPFYTIDALKAAVEGFVAEINADPSVLATRGPASKYVLDPGTEEEQKGVLTLTWGSHCLEGVACNIDSPGFAALTNAVELIKGEVKPYSICGSLPLVKEMQDAGFDIQITGFGLSSVYHGDNEYCLLSDMSAAFKVLHQIACQMESGPTELKKKNKDLYD